MKEYINDQSVPYVCMFVQLERPLSSLVVQDMKSVSHEDTEFNSDYSVDPLSDPRLDKMDLFNMVDTEDRDKIMSAQSSFDTGAADFDVEVSSIDSSSESGSGE